MRLIAGILAGQDFDSVVTGDDSLRQRPMRRIAAPLTAMGARIATTDGHAPLTISGGHLLRGMEHVLPMASAQVKSCALLAGLYAENETVVIEPALTRDHTERMLRRFGVDVRSQHIPDVGYRHSINGSAEPRGGDCLVPADISSAAFFIVGAACLSGSDIVMRNVGINPTRRDVIGVLEQCGANITVTHEGAVLDEPQDLESDHEPTAEIHVRGGFSMTGTRGPGIIRGELIPKVIDEIPILAILGSQLSEGLEVRDAAELRVKESDRISAVVENLRRMNGAVEEFDDGFRVGRSSLKGARVDSFGDHRIAMAFAIAGIVAEGETEIDGADCASVSFPGFFEVLQDVAVFE